MKNGEFGTSEPEEDVLDVAAAMLEKVEIENAQARFVEGKSTLMQAIFRRELPIPEHVDMFLVSREMAASNDKSHEKLMDIYDRLEDMDADKAEVKAAEILFGLGFTRQMMLKKCKDFSVFPDLVVNNLSGVFKDYIARFGHGSAKLARQAQSKEKTMAKMVASGLTEKVVTEK
uniref:Uncharacterized protein n=1 Tax=Parascaris equorum TaxID=6256 RepID=A0A914S4X4_PAREQ